ncbi:MAG: nuclear transport factor 2 family protein [Nitrososphaera sp.]|uniref:nuclear transport factor 2 family protein n=1 Tax=Nitrososphaera sp. TaxID=1971748 RepID=UPI003D6EB930
MGKALELTNRFYDLTNNKNTTDGLKEMLTDDMGFSGPLIRASGAKNYIEMVGPFLKSHKEWRMLKQFENGGDVCSIYELDLRTPSGGAFSVTIADWIRVSGDRIAEQRVYYDPREFAKAFGISS